uniref:Putative secreted protein n=1 Tax=Anopheles marajoara TaxID=58244 RepID=A0A2M4CE07_9DIPT
MSPRGEGATQTKEVTFRLRLFLLLLLHVRSIFLLEATERCLSHHRSSVVSMPGSYPHPRTHTEGLAQNAHK